MRFILPLRNQRAPDLPEFTKPLYEKVKKVFKTAKGQVFLYPGSGTGAWESALTNTLSAGDKVLIYRFGTFSLLWADMMTRLGLDVDVVDRPWGTGTPPEDVCSTLE